MAKTAVQAIADGLNALGVSARVETATPGLNQIIVELESGERMEIMQLPRVQAPSVLQFYVPLGHVPSGCDQDALRRFLGALNLSLPLPAVELLESSGALHLRYMLACLDQAIDFERVLLTSRMLAWEVAQFGPVVREAALEGASAGQAILERVLRANQPN